MSEDKRAPSIINAGLLPNPGPYLARIVNNADPMKQGSLEVELLRPIGNQKDAGQQTFVVRYLSPFYGCTGIDVTGTDQVEFNDTQKSYGFWAVPPDVGVTVMVIFVDSDPGQGFWMGCVQDALMNHMIPGIAGSTAFQDKVRGNDDIQWLEVEETKKRYGEEAKLLPVGEINRNVFKNSGDKGPTPNPNVEANKKPIHPIAERILTQGLINDPYRGVHTSSARRESPSNVYGWSTPGPVDKRKNAKKGKIGRLESKINKFVSRMGGHSIVMDDGDDRFLRKTRPWEGPPEYADLEKGEEGLVDFPKDESLRIRTRKGAQILMHSSEDFIYITNSRGTAWMEFTSNGKIEIYAKEGVHLASGGDFQVNAQRHVAIQSGGDQVRVAGGNTTESTGGDHTRSTKVGAIFDTSASDHMIQAANYVYTEGTAGHHMKGDTINFSGSAFNWKVGGTLHIDCGSGNMEIKAANTLITSDFQTHILAGNELRIMGSDVHMISGSGDITANAYGSLNLDTDNSLTVNAGTGISLKSKLIAQHGTDGMSMKAGGTGMVMSSGGAMSMKSTGNMLADSGGEIRMQGGEAQDAPNGADQPYPAKEPIPADQSGGAAGSQTAGGGYSYASEAKVFPTSYGESINKNPPGPEPHFHENKSPADLHVRRYNKDDPRAITSSGSNLTVRTNLDLHDMSSSQGGSKNGVLADNIHFANFDVPNMSSSFTARPLDPEYTMVGAREWVKDKEFLGKVQSLAGQFGMKQEEALAVLGILTEYTMSPSKRSAGGTRVGLIKFGPKEASDAGTNTGSLAKMSRAEQVEYVQKYLSKKGGIKSPDQMFLAIAAPDMMNKGEDEELWKRGTTEWSHKRNWRINGVNGPITRKGIREAIKKEAGRIKSMIGSGNSNTGKGPTYPGQNNASNARTVPTPTQNPSFVNGGGTNPSWKNSDGSTNT